MDETMDTDLDQNEVTLQLRLMNISSVQTSASLPATSSSDSIVSLASVSEADSGMGSETEKVILLDYDV